MGMPIAPSAGLAGALFSPVQQRVLGLLYGQPDRQFQSAELIRLAASGTGAVHRYLQQLARAGHVVTRQLGNQKFYKANHRSPVFHEMCGIILKTVGLVEPLRDAMIPLKKTLRAAFVYGSVASGTDQASSDIDLLIISDRLTYAQVFDAVRPAEEVLARTINPVLMTSAEWRRKHKARDTFASRIFAGPKVFIAGTEADIT